MLTHVGRESAAYEKAHMKKAGQKPGLFLGHHSLSQVENSLPLKDDL
jgi:hypothetical protein